MENNREEVITALCDKKPLQNVKSVCVTQDNDVSVELSITVEIFIGQP